MTRSPSLDVITIGRASMDLYGAQVGGRLEDMASFSKAVGGCPTNIAVGPARLGLRSGLVTRVGHEHMGRFIRERLTREGVETVRGAESRDAPRQAARPQGGARRRIPTLPSRPRRPRRRRGLHDGALRGHLRGETIETALADANDRAGRQQRLRLHR